MELNGKRVLITAAGQGIGYSSARLFADAGAEVIASDINIDALHDLPGITPLRLDVTRAVEIADAAESLGPIDVLFNCAGVVHSGSILDCSEQEWQFALDLNVTAMFHTVRAFLPGMLARGGGSIINMSSVASSVKGVPNRFAYSASKAAVIGLTLGGRRFCNARYTLQRHLPRHGRFAIAARTYCRSGARAGVERGGGVRRLRRPPADRPYRRAGRDRAPGALPGF